MAGIFTGARKHFIVVVMVAFAAIMGGFSSSPAVHAQPAAASAQLRVVHTVFDAPAVDVYMNGSKALSGLAYKEIAPRVALAAGDYDFKVTPAGKTNTLIESKVSLESGKSYTFLALGRMADMTGKVLVDDLSPLASGQSRVRLVHASPDTPAVDVAVKDGSVLYPNLGLGESSNYFTLPASPLSVEVRPAGTTTVALSVPSLSLSANTAYTVYVVGLSSGSPGLSTLVESDSVASTNQPTQATTNNTQIQVNTQPASTLPTTGEPQNSWYTSSVALLLASLLAACAIAAGSAIRIGVGVRARNK